MTKLVVMCISEAYTLANTEFKPRLLHHDLLTYDIAAWPPSGQ